MKRIVLAAAVFAALLSAPASASVAPTPIKETASRGVPFCQKFPDVCAAWCASNPDRLMCHVA
jgi:opacity protein-like surface antigen